MKIKSILAIVLMTVFTGSFVMAEAQITDCMKTIPRNAYVGTEHIPVTGACVLATPDLIIPSSDPSMIQDVVTEYNYYCKERWQAIIKTQPAGATAPIYTSTCPAAAPAAQKH